MLLSRLLHAARERSAEKVALWFGDRRWTAAELDDSSDRVAAGLTADGVRAGDRIGLFMPNCPELLLSYLACWKLGAIAVPLNYRYRSAEARYALEHSGATVLIVHQALVSEVLPLADLRLRRCLAGGPAEPPFISFEALLDASGPVPQTTFDEKQPAAILYTSGTTARPKGVTYTHGTLDQNCAIQCETFAFGPDDVHLISTAVCHAAALTGQFLPNLLAGGTIVLTHLPTPEQVVHAIASRRITRIQMLPASLEDLVEYLEEHPGVDLSSLRCCTAGGDVVPLELHHRFRRAIGFDVTELCGMTEALSYVTNPPFGPKKLGSVGLPAARTELRLVDDQQRDVPDGERGEILVRSPMVMVGYWKNPEATAAALRDGWLYTGDLGRRDPDGFHWFVGRKKEIIIRGGSNISPLEVEEALDAHPAVHLSCVVGVPDAHYGETVAAYVALREGVTAPTAEELRQFVAARLAAYMVPERIQIVAELPLNATGKVDRKKLHAEVLASGGRLP